MTFAIFQRLFGLLLTFTGVSQIPPLLVALYFSDTSIDAFLFSACGEILLGLLLFLPVRSGRIELRVRDGFLVVVLAWLTVGIGAAIPFWLIKQPYIGAIDGLFEAMSALTTTGATVLTGLDTLPHGLLYHRAQLQWLGGIGIIVLAVAVLPMLRIGGMQLFRAETPGPMKDSKLTPRITETAKALWLIYLVLTAACAIAYWLAGMQFFDAITHAFTTVPIGGFSNYDASLAHFNNPLIEMVAMLFMVIAGMNFALHFLAWRNASTLGYFQDSELRIFLSILGFFILLVSFEIIRLGISDDIGQALRLGAFQTISTLTTTGYTIDSFYLWPGYLPTLFLILCLIGGCAGSTAGGMKVIRIMLLYQQMVREIRRLVHPNAVLAIKLGDRAVSDNIISAVWAFFFLYIACIMIIGMLLHASGLDLLTAFSATIACLTNLGPGLGDVGPHYGNLETFPKLLLTLAMLLGRLELFTILVLFTPGFWKD